MILALLLHLSAVAAFGYAIYWQQRFLGPFPWDTAETRFAGLWKYYTNWDLLVQFAYFVLSLLCDLQSLGNRSSNLMTKTRQVMFYSWTFPMAMIVASVFWGLYFVDRELIFPAQLDPFFPSWLNHVVHTIIVPLVLVESFICHLPVPSRRVGLTVLNGLLVTYTIWTLFVFFFKGHWVYPFLRVFNWPQRIVFFVFTGLFHSMIYFFGCKLHSVFWPASRLKKSVKSTAEQKKRETRAKTKAK